jgi:hypothetical protein
MERAIQDDLPLVHIQITPEQDEQGPCVARKVRDSLCVL